MGVWAKDPDGRFEGRALWGIALWQRVMRVYMAVYLVAVVLMCVGVNVEAVLLVTCLGAPVVMAPLAFKMHGPLMAGVMVFLSLGFVVGWAVMALLNVQANEILRRHGIEVGLWGAERRRGLG